MALKIDEKLMKRYLDAEMTRGFKGERWEKYFRGKAAWLVELTNGIIYCIEREEIETEFCYGESGYDADDAYAACNRAMSSVDHFKASNLKSINDKIRLLGEKTDEIYGLNGSYKRFEDLYIFTGEEVVDSFRTRHYYAIGDDRLGFKYRLLNREDRARLLKGYMLVKEDFEKRIDRYLNRYGLSKVRAWTYWRDA